MTGMKETHVRGVDRTRRDCWYVNITLKLLACVMHPIKTSDEYF